MDIKHNNLIITAFEIFIIMVIIAVYIVAITLLYIQLQLKQLHI